MSKKFKENPTELMYCLTLYKLAGHKTWRADLGRNERSFNKSIAQWGPTAPKVTDKKKFRIDRLSSLITPI